MRWLALRTSVLILSGVHPGTLSFDILTLRHKRPQLLDASIILSLCFSYIPSTNLLDLMHAVTCLESFLPCTILSI